MSTKIKITADVNMSDQGYESEPVSVTVSGAGFLQASAVVDIAQEALDSHFGLPSGQHRYMAVRPYDVGDVTVVEVVKR